MAKEKETIKKEEKKMEKKEEKPKKKKVKEKKMEKKENAIARGLSLRISQKHTAAICKVIKFKTPENAIKRLEETISGRRAIPMAGLEVAHQKGMSGGRFPKNACKEIITLIKQVEANAILNGVENPIITIAMSNRAAAPYKKGGRKAKRTHLLLEVRDRTKVKRKKK